MQLPATTRPFVRFHPFTVDLVSHELHNNGRKISLQGRPFQVLAILLEQHGRVVTRGSTGLPCAGTASGIRCGSGASDFAAFE